MLVTPASCLTVSMLTDVVVSAISCVGVVKAPICEETRPPSWVVVSAETTVGSSAWIWDDEKTDQLGRGD